MRYDLAIIGTGPAGLSAALTAKNRNLNFILYGSSNLSDKIAKAHQINNYLGLPSVTGSELAAAFHRQLQEAGISIHTERIGSIFSMGDYFNLQAGQSIAEAGAVILAAGVTNAKPYPGEKELLGQGVSYCATCDGMFYKGHPVAVIAGSRSEESEASFLNGLASEVLYFPLYKEQSSLDHGIREIREQPRKIVKNADGSDRRLTLYTDASEYAVDGVFILREAIAPDRLVPGIATQNGHVIVNRKMETNIPGLFAAGDITGTPYQYMKAAGEGNVAAISAAAWLTAHR